ncbi:MAG: GatB/YqeY domain-containing protein [Patescibacteria group bacterium]|nr:GatB/YqeY domain-containing protein [Patescibacteria group bacterium]MDE1988490.1 GatB/YqeY domain-containing protein [Patescibacteria group bacterium]MDE2218133.1 GatB/YqeY domain-containing protein [Patescibacteria group bacterium]
MLQKQIKEQIKMAMLAKDAVRLIVLRGLLASFTNELVATKRRPQEELSDAEAVAVIRRSVKQRKDSMDQFKRGGREDLAEAEEAELKILETYLPKMMSKEDVKKKVAEVKEKLGIADKSKIGQLIGATMKELNGLADGADVKEAAESLFL